QHGGDQQIQKTGNDCSGWNDQTREINFRYQIGIGDQTVAGFSECIGEELPGQHCGKHQNWIRDAVGWHLGDPAKYDRKNYHGDKGAKDRPNHADGGLFVPNRKVSPSEYVEELAIAPEISPVVFLGTSRFNQKFLHLCALQKLQLVWRTDTFQSKMPCS